jgi:alpha-galactosidase
MTRQFRYAVFNMKKASDTENTIVAKELTGDLERGGFPDADSWKLAAPIRFASDWRGKNEDLARGTQVRVLWNAQSLFLQFVCRYRTLTTFEDGHPNGRRDQLWDRDVAEVFIQTDSNQPRRYLEFEVSPNGMWIDLEISPEGKRDPRSGMKSQVAVNESEKLWTATIVLPMHALAHNFDPNSEWRVNFFRVEGPTEPRFYSSWRPTHTPQPNFHVPEAFGKLLFHA